MADIVNAAWYMRGAWPDHTVYVGRNPAIWQRAGGQGPIVFCNKFPVAIKRASESPEQALSKVIEADRGHNMLKMQDSAYAAQVKGLFGKNLACHCAPKPCHGHTLKAATDALHGMASFPSPTPLDLTRFLGVMVGDHWAGTSILDPMRQLAKTLVAMGAAQASKTSFSPNPQFSSSVLTPELAKQAGDLGMAINQSALDPRRLLVLRDACVQIQAPYPVQSLTQAPKPKRSLENDL